MLSSVGPGVRRRPPEIKLGFFGQRSLDPSEPCDGGARVVAIAPSRQPTGDEGAWLLRGGPREAPLTPQRRIAQS